MSETSSAIIAFVHTVPQSSENFLTSASNLQEIKSLRIEMQLVLPHLSPFLSLQLKKKLRARI